MHSPLSVFFFNETLHFSRQMRDFKQLCDSLGLSGWRTPNLLEKKAGHPVLSSQAQSCRSTPDTQGPSEVPPKSSVGQPTRSLQILPCGRVLWRHGTEPERRGKRVSFWPRSILTSQQEHSSHTETTQILFLMLQERQLINCTWYRVCRSNSCYMVRRIRNRLVLSSRGLFNSKAVHGATIQEKTLLLNVNYKYTHMSF